MHKKTLIFTGATGGMGRIAVPILAEQYRVIAIDRDKRELMKLANDHHNIRYFQADFTNNNWLDGLTEKLYDQPLAGLVNLAGASLGDTCSQISDQAWDTTLQINVTAPMKLIRWASSHLIKQQAGSIINVGSPVGIVGARKASYAASKAAMLGLTMSVARELGQYNIRANLLLPGPTITDMTEDWPQAKRHKIAQSCYLKRLCLPQEIAATMAFLLSDQASYITGSVLDMTAGSMFGH